MKKTSQIDRVRMFFQEKFLFKNKLQEIEKIIFSTEEKIQILEDHLRNMKMIAKEQNSTYFLHRLQKLEALVADFRSKKGYQKKEFDSLYVLLSKLKEDDSTEFLGELLNKRLDDAAKALLPDSETVWREHGFIPFSWNGTWYLLPDFEFKVVTDHPTSKTKVKYNKKIYKIYPEVEIPNPLDKESTNRNVLVLLGEILDGSYRCYFFDELEERITIEAEVVENSLKETGKYNSPIRGIFRFKGKKYFLLKV